MEGTVKKKSDNGKMINISSGNNSSWYYIPSQFKSETENTALESKVVFESEKRGGSLYLTTFSNSSPLKKEEIKKPEPEKPKVEETPKKDDNKEKEDVTGSITQKKFTTKEEKETKTLTTQENLKLLELAINLSKVREGNCGYEYFKKVVRTTYEELKEEYLNK